MLEGKKSRRTRSERTKRRERYLLSDRTKNISITFKASTNGNNETFINDGKTMVFIIVFIYFLN